LFCVILAQRQGFVARIGRPAFQATQAFSLCSGAAKGYLPKQDKR